LAKLVDEFGISHAEVGAKIGKSREYVSNSIRLLALPEDMQQAVINKEMTEGHARTLLALNDRPEERETLFKEIILKKLPVRAAERIARSIAQERVRKYHRKTPEMVEMEKSLTETLGTRVIIEANEQGGRVTIDFFSPEDLSSIVSSLAAKQAAETPVAQGQGAGAGSAMPVFPNTTQLDPIAPAAPEEKNDDDLYAVQNFVL
jgi:ParB family chromosome partitioning protein